jgi:DNA-binding MarR family transcriptional regulator
MRGSRRSTRPPDRNQIGAALFGLVSPAVKGGSRDVSLSSLSTLSNLDHTGPRRVTELAVIEGVSQPAMTVQVKMLERMGLVERRSDPTDKRARLIALTPAGSRLLRQRRRAGAEVFVELVEKLSPAETEVLATAAPVLEHLAALYNDMLWKFPVRPPGE